MGVKVVGQGVFVMVRWLQFAETVDIGARM